MSKEIKVKRIGDGTVIDHISGGQALNVLKILGITEAYPTAPVSVAMNVPSKKLGSKDIVKIEGRELDSDEVGKISLISPYATINIIRNKETTEKKKVALPEIIEGVLKCANPNCISNHETTKTGFKIEEESPIKIRCIHCERVMHEQDIVTQF